MKAPSFVSTVLHSRFGSPRVGIGISCLLIAWNAVGGPPPTLTLRIAPPGGSNEFAATPELGWDAEAGVSYVIQTTTNLADAASWRGAEVAVKAASGPIRWMAPESIRESKFYRLVTQPAVYDVEPTFVNSDDTNAALYLFGQLLPTNAVVVINGQQFLLEQIGEGHFGVVYRIGLNGLPPGEPVIGTISILDPGTSNVVATLPVQSPIYYGPTPTTEQLQGPPDEPPASPQALGIAIWASKKGYDYYQAQSSMRYASKKGYDYWQAQSALQESGATAARKGYDYYQAKSDLGAAGAQTNPFFQANDNAGEMPTARYLSKRGYDYYQAQSALVGFLSKKGYDYYQAQSALMAYLSKKGYDYYQAQSARLGASAHNNPAFSENNHQGAMPESSRGHSRILPSSGEVQLEATDLAIPGAMLDFAWTRTYRSRTGTTTPQGAGWDFSFNVSLTQNGDGTITLRPGNGRADTFYPAGTNGWFRDEYFCQIIDLNSDSFPDVLFADTSRWIFNPLGTPAGGKLAQIIDRNGNTISLDYNNKGQLATIVDDVGRTNTVTFNGQNQLVAVTDFTGRSVKYEYDANGDLVSVISPPVTGTPTGNDFPGGITNRYTYSSGYPNAAENHLLLSVIDGKQQVRYQHVYQHNQTDLEFLRCVSVQAGTNPPTQCRYIPHEVNPPLHFAATQCIVNDPVGNVTEYFCDTRGRCVLERAYTGRATPGVPVTDTVNRPTGKLRSEDPDYFETQWSWNADSLGTSETRPDGEVTEFTYQRTFNQNSSRSNHGQSLGPIDDSLHNGDLRVLRVYAAPGGGADLDGDGVNDITDLAWHFDYDPRFGSPDAARKVHGIHHGEKPSAARGKKLYVGNLPSLDAARGPRQTTSLDGSYSGGLVRDRLGRPAINTALNSLADIIPDDCSSDAGVPGNTFGRDKLKGTVKTQGDFNLANRFSVEIDGCISATDPRGNATTAGYDAKGNCTVVAARDNHLQGAADVIQSVRFAYSPQGQLTYITNALDGKGYSRVDKINYYSSGPQSGQVQSIAIDEPGVLITSRFEYDAVGNLTRYVDPRTNDWLFTYNALDQCIRVQSPTNILARHTTDFLYDANGNVSDAIEELRDDSDAFVRNVTTHGEFDALDRCAAVAEQVSPGVFVTNRFNYDGNDQLTRVESPLAVSGADPHAVAQFEYDERGLLFREIGATVATGTATNQYDYDSNGACKRVNKIEAIVLKQSLMNYDGFHQLVGVTDPMGNLASFNYDRNGNLALIRCYGETNDVPGSAGNRLIGTRTIVSDALNRCLQTQDAFFDPATGAAIGKGVATTTFAYAPNGACTSVTDDNHHSTTFAYDTVGRLASVTDPKANVRSFTYDASGNVTALTSTEKSDLTPVTAQVFTLAFGYDALNRCVQSVDNVSNTNRCTFDSLGRCVQTVNPGGALSWLQYDDLGRCLMAQADQDGDGVPEAADPALAWAYDDNSRCIAAVDANSNLTRYAYDSLGCCVTVTNADLTTTKLIWSPRSNLLVSEDANGTTVTNTYDLCDRVIHRDIATRNLLVAKTTTFESFAYDGLWRLVAATNDAAHDEFSYDSLGNCGRQSQDGLATVCAFDGVGNKLVMTYPSGLVVTYGYNADDEVTSVGTSGGGLPPSTQVTFDYEGPGRIGRIARANNINTRIGWDGLANPGNAGGDFGWRQVSGVNHQVAGGGAVIDRRAAKYDRNQNRTQRTQLSPFFTGGPLQTNNFGYDALNRLKDSERSLLNTIRIYDLDANGNRLAVSSNGVAEIYAMDHTTPAPADFQMNQYTLTPFGQQTYDDNGDLLARSSPAAQTFYQYDYANRLVEVSAFDSGSGSVVPVASYAYGPLGERVRKTVYSTSPLLPPVTTTFVRCKSTEVCGNGIKDTQVGEVCDRIIETWQNGVLVDSLVDLSDDSINPLLAVPANGSPVHYLTDDLGNTLAVADAGGNVIERCDYDDFGQPQFLTSDGVPMATNSSPAGNLFLFRGMEWDGETGYYHRGGGNGFDPQTGRSINGINNGMPNRISMNVTVPKQTQGATFGEKVNMGLHAAGGALSQGISLNPWSHGGGPPAPLTAARELTERSRLRHTGVLTAKRNIVRD